MNIFDLGRCHFVPSQHTPLTNHVKFSEIKALKNSVSSIESEIKKAVREREHLGTNYQRFLFSRDLQILENVGSELRGEILDAQIWIRANADDYRHSKTRKLKVLNRLSEKINIAISTAHYSNFPPSIRMRIR